MANKVFLVFVAMLVFFTSTDVSGLNLNELIGPEHAAALIAGEKPVIAQFKDPKPQLVPQNTALRDLVEAIRRDLNPSVMVETLQIYRKPPETGKYLWSAREEMELYNAALALSTLAGLQYFSQSRGTMRTFYETSSVIDGPSTKKPVPDPVFSRPPSELSIFSRQKDLTFGDNIYQYDYYSVPGAFFFVQQNLSSLTYGILRAVAKNNLRSILAVLDSEEYLLIYAGSMAKAASLPGMNTRVGDSFANRADAVVHWFTDQADNAFRKAGGGF